MKQIRTAREMLVQIENDFFKGVCLSKASLLEDGERRAFKLSQVERLLTEKHGDSSLAMLLSDMFWTADEGRVLPLKPNPLLLLNEQQSLPGEEIEKLRLILEVSGLCHDLSLHFIFDSKETFGIRKNDLWVSNKQLVEWLLSTEYEHIAMHTAYIMKKHAINVYEYGHYLPAQDELAELFSTKYQCLISYPDNTNIPPRDYVHIILTALLEIERHWQRGRRLKLRPDLVILHDEIHGVVPRKFDKVALKAAQALYNYMDTELCGQFVTKDFKAWSEQPKSVKLAVSEKLNRFAEKVREVRAEYLAEGWLTDGSLAFNYLMSHAERCGDGWWREEDDAL